MSQLRRRMMMARGHGGSAPVGNYIEFADPAVKAICVANWGSDGELTYEQAAAVTSIGTVFKGNTEIVSFDEFKWFTGITGSLWQTFQNCSNLQTIQFGAITPSDIGGTFDACVSLEALDISMVNGTKITSIESIVAGCTNLRSFNAYGLATPNSQWFQYMLYQCSNLVSLDMRGWNASKQYNDNNTFTGLSKLTSFKADGGYFCGKLSVYYINGMTAWVDAQEIADLVQSLQPQSSEKKIKMSANTLAVANSTMVDGQTLVQLAATKNWTLY